MSTVHVMMAPQQVRQGDVLITPMYLQFQRGGPDSMDRGEEVVEGMENVSQKRIVLAYGEVTGHAHAIYPETDIAEAVQEAQKPDSSPASLHVLRNPSLYCGTSFREAMYLHVRTRCFLRHEEHDTISIAPGHYVVIRQHEFDEEQMRRVAD